MRLDYNDALFAVPQEQLDAHAQLAVAAYQEIIQKSGRGNDFLGWLSLPEDVTEQDIQDIEECAAKLAAQSKVVVVIGIGDSYLGARAVIEALQHCFKPMMRSDTPTVLYAGNNMSEDYIHDLLNVLDENDYSLVVIFVNIPFDEQNTDGLNYLQHRSIDEICHIAQQGTCQAHVDGQVPNIKITIPEINEFHLGELIYFFEMSCAISGYMLKVNPFDQSGVEAYKRNMFQLLGKPGYEKN